MHKHLHHFGLVWGIKSLFWGIAYRRFLLFISDFETNNGLLIEELGLLSRAVFVLDEEGVIRYKEVLEEVGEEPDYNNALDALKKL